MICSSQYNITIYPVVSVICSNAANAMQCRSAVVNKELFSIGSSSQTPIFPNMLLTDFKNPASFLENEHLNFVQLSVFVCLIIWVASMDQRIVSLDYCALYKYCYLLTLILEMLEFLYNIVRDRWKNVSSQQSARFVCTAVYIEHRLIRQTQHRATTYRHAVKIELKYVTSNKCC